MANTFLVKCLACYLTFNSVLGSITKLRGMFPLSSTLLPKNVSIITPLSDSLNTPSVALAGILNLFCRWELNAGSWYFGIWPFVLFYSL